MFGAMLSRMIRCDSVCQSNFRECHQSRPETDHQFKRLRKGRRPKRLSQRGRLTVLSPIRVSRAWSLCRAPGQGLQQELVAVPETVPVETLRLSQTIAEPVLVASPRPESARALVLEPLAETVEAP
jgi:hypothetical protein